MEDSSTCCFYFHENEKNVYCSGVESKQFLAQPWHLPNTSTAKTNKSAKKNAINNCNSLYIVPVFYQPKNHLRMIYVDLSVCVSARSGPPNYHKISFSTLHDPTKCKTNTFCFPAQKPNPQSDE